jgi:hypothetical protein
VDADVEADVDADSQAKDEAAFDTRAYSLLRNHFVHTHTHQYTKRICLTGEGCSDLI